MGCKNSGEKIGWCASNFPQEIAETLGLCVVYPENQAAAIAAKGAGLKMCEHAESMGYSNDICAYARISSLTWILNSVKRWICHSQTSYCVVTISVTV